MIQSLVTMPPEVLLPILQNLRDVDLARMRKVCQGLNAFILNTDQLYLKLIPRECAFAAKSIALSSKGTIQGSLFKVQRLEALFNRSLAKKTALLLGKDAGYGLFEVVKQEALEDIPAAKETASTIKKQSIMDDAHLKIVKVEARKDYVAARATALLIKESIKRAEAFVDIAEVDPAHDLTDAHAALQEPTDDDFSRALVQVRMAQLDPQHNFTDAKNSAEREGGLARDVVLRHVTLAEAQHDLNAAKNTLLLLNPQSTAHSLTAFELVERVARNDISEAKALAQTIVNKYFRACAYVEIAKVDPEHDLTDVYEAMKAMKHLEDLRQLIDVLLKLKKAGLNPEESFKHAKRNALQFHTKLENIVEIEAQEDLDQAICTASKLFGFLECSAWLRIAEIHPSHLKTARKLAFDLPIHDDISQKIEALCNVAQVALKLLQNNQ